MRAAAALLLLAGCGTLDESAAAHLRQARCPTMPAAFQPHAGDGWIATTACAQWPLNEAGAQALITAPGALMGAARSLVETLRRQSGCSDSDWQCRQAYLQGQASLQVREGRPGTGTVYCAATGICYYCGTEVGACVGSDGSIGTRSGQLNPNGWPEYQQGTTSPRNPNAQWNAGLGAADAARQREDAMLEGVLRILPRGKPE